MYTHSGGVRDGASAGVPSGAGDHSEGHHPSHGRSGTRRPGVLVRYEYCVYWHVHVCSLSNLMYGLQIIQITGEWVESYWSPLTRARDRGLTGLVQVFSTFQQQHGIRDGASAVPTIQAPAVPAPSAATFTKLLSLGTPASGPIQQSPINNNIKDVSVAVASTGDRSPQHGVIPFHQEFRPQNNNVNSSNEYMSNAAVPVKSQPLNNNNNNNYNTVGSSSGGVNNYSGVNPIRFTSPGSDYDAGTVCMDIACMLRVYTLLQAY